MKSINKSKHLVLCNHCPGRQPRPLPHARLMTIEGQPPSAIGRPLLTGDPFHLPFFLPSLHKYRRDLDKPQSWFLCSSSGERRRSGPTGCVAWIMVPRSTLLAPHCPQDKIQSPQRASHLCLSDPRTTDCALVPACGSQEGAAQV